MRLPVTLEAICPWDLSPCLVHRICSDRYRRQLLRSRLHTCNTEQGIFSGATPSRNALCMRLAYKTAQLCTNLFSNNFQDVLSANRVWVVSPKLHTD